MTTPRNDGLPELLPCPFCNSPAERDEGFGGYVRCANNHCILGGPVDKSDPDCNWYGEAAWNRRASPQPLLSREHEPVSNASVTVGGVRVPGPMELNEANLLRYGADYLDGWNSYDEHLRLNHAAEVEEADQAELDRCERLLTACTCIDDYKNRGRTDPTCEACSLGVEIIETFRLLRRLAGSGRIGMGTLDAMLHEGVPAHVAEKVMKLIRGEQ